MSVAEYCSAVEVWDQRTLMSHVCKNSWFAVQVQPRREQTASSHLVQQGFQVFCPVMSRTVRHARQFRERQLPVFPGYVFVSFDPSTSPWRRINGTRGVIGLVTMGSSPAKLPDAAVQSLFEAFSPAGAGRKAHCMVGDRVRLVSGPFTDAIGTLASLDAQGRVAVLIDLLGMSVPVKSRVSHVLPLPIAAFGS